MQIMSSICSVLISRFSFGRYCAKPSAAEPRGTMLTLSSGSAQRRNQAATAWPASWKATVRRSSLLITCVNGRARSSQQSSIVRTKV